jgi:site-specific DNA-methyltransferase (adenine-specific)
MAEHKNMEFDRPGGYAMPTGATFVHRRAAESLVNADIRLYGDTARPHEPKTARNLKPKYQRSDPDTRVFVGDCRDVLAGLPDAGDVDLIFADPPFNWDVPYDEWHDGMPREEYERFTFDWLDACVEALNPRGSLWVNIPDDTAAEAVMHLKRRGLTMINWCIWHFRFGQHRDSSFIRSKVHVLYFVKNPDTRIWNAGSILEPSDRASVYFDPRTMAKETNKGLRVPMDVWYGRYWYLERIIRACSHEGDLVLDPFLGSGTTSTVARALGRRSIGIEYSPVHARAAWDRIVNVGMVRKDAAAGQSTALFRPRRRRPVAREAPAAGA